MIILHHSYFLDVPAEKTLFESRAMKVLPHRLGFAWQRTSCSKQLFSGQEIRQKATYTTRSVSGDRNILGRRFYSAFSRDTLSDEHPASVRHAGSAEPLSGSNIRDSAGDRDSYITNAMAAQEPTVHEMFETNTGTWQYVVADPSTLTAVIIDPVLNYDRATQVVSTQAADSLLSLVREKGYKVDRILETHAHADHLTAASYLQSRLALEQGHEPPISIGKRIEQVQKLFGDRYGIPPEEYKGVFGKLFDDDELFHIGDLEATAIHLPGHTPDHLGYKIGGKAGIKYCLKAWLTEVQRQRILWGLPIPWGYRHCPL